MRAALFLVLVPLLVGGCSDRGTASGPVSAEATAPSKTSAAASDTEATLASEPTAAVAPSAPPSTGPEGDDDDSASPKGDDDDSASPKGDDDDSASPKTAATTAAAGAVVPDKKETLCSDRKDNDGDRAVDCDDTDCWPVAECEAPGPGDWDEQGPGPDLGKDGEQAPGPESADGGAWKPSDEGVGVACTDYIGCVCGLFKAEEGRTVGGYSHASACEKSSALVGNEVEEYCGAELDKLKGILADAADDYAAAKITMPASCN